MSTAHKNYDPEMHTTEHILNRTMVNMFGCGRSFSAHLEKKKSSCDYHFDRDLTPAETQAIADTVNSVIRRNLDVTEKFMTPEEASAIVDLSKIPEYSKGDEQIRIISVGDYDDCACIGPHVKNTHDIRGVFRMRSAKFNEGVLRLTWCVK